MKLSPAITTIASLAVLALGCSAPAWARSGGDGEPTLRLPGEPGLRAWTTAPALKLRTWAHDWSDRLALIARPQLPDVQWRAEGRSVARLQTERPLLVERTRSALTAHWRPWTVGHWRLGAAMGFHRALPSTGSGTPSFAAMPMASYEQVHYRVNLGLLPPNGDRASALLLGVTIPLR